MRTSDSTVSAFYPVRDRTFAGPGARVLWYGLTCGLQDAALHLAGQSVLRRSEPRFLPDRLPASLLAIHPWGRIDRNCLLRRSRYPPRTGSAFGTTIRDQRLETRDLFQPLETSRMPISRCWKLGVESGAKRVDFGLAGTDLRAGLPDLGATVPDLRAMPSTSGHIARISGQLCRNAGQLPGTLARLPATSGQLSGTSRQPSGGSIPMARVRDNCPGTRDSCPEARKTGFEQKAQ